MSEDTARRLQEWAVWYTEHKRDGTLGDPLKKQEFILKALDGIFDLLSRVAEDLRDLEGRPREYVGRRLWTPGSIRVRGDLRRFG